MNQATKTTILQRIAEARSTLEMSREEVCRPYPEGIVPTHVREVLNVYDEATSALAKARRAVMEIAS